MSGETYGPVERFWAPRRLDDLVDLRAEFAEGATLIAGGTDLGVMMRRRNVAPSHLVSVLRVDELQRIDTAGGSIRVGAAVTHRRLERADALPAPFRALQEACATVGGIQTRNVGTIGGNIVNASPAADTPPALLALDAAAELRSVSGLRTLPMNDVFTGYRRTAMRTDEVLTAVRLAVPAAPTGSAFLKVGRRHAMEISVTCAAARVTLDGSVVTGVGIGLGAVAATAIRARAAEDLLLGETIDDDRLDAAAQAASAAINPIDDHRASAAYRRRITPVVVRRALALAVERAFEEERARCA